MEKIVCFSSVMKSFFEICWKYIFNCGVDGYRFFAGVFNVKCISMLLQPYSPSAVCNVSFVCCNVFGTMFISVLWRHLVKSNLEWCEILIVAEISHILKDLDSCILREGNNKTKLKHTIYLTIACGYLNKQHSRILIVAQSLSPILLGLDDLTKSCGSQSRVIITYRYIVRRSLIFQLKKHSLRVRQK
ncbi:hypothetical protein GmHk_10G028633 [Glycine max]|nr:hypothetical protein GmHk_10G028633 [Glycine max]